MVVITRRLNLYALWASFTSRMPSPPATPPSVSPVMPDLRGRREAGEGVREGEGESHKVRGG